MAASLAQDGLPDEAIRCYRQLIEKDSTCFAAWYHVGLLYRDTGDVHLSMEAFRHCIVLRPSEPWPYFHLAYVVGASPVSRYRESISLLRRALELDSGCHEFRLNLGNALASRHQLSEAVQVMSLLPATLSGWWAAARDNAVATDGRTRRDARLLLAERRKGRRADRLKEHWLTPTENLQLARHLAALGKTRPALRIVCALMESDHPTWEPFALYAEILANREGVEAAAAFLKDVCSHFPGNLLLKVALARYYLEAGAYQQALSALSGPVQSQLPEARALVSAILFNMKEGSQLLSHCAKWIASDPEDTLPHAYAISALRLQNALSRFADAGVPHGHATKPDKPFRIVQFWDSENPPPEVLEAMGTWHNAHPELEHLVFNEHSAREYLLRHYGIEAAAAFDSCHHAAMKSDLFRVAFLARDGGVYVDADEICRRPLYPLLRELSPAGFIAAMSADAVPYVYNAFLMATPGFPILRDAFQRMLSDLLRLKQAGARADIWHTTGPGQMTRAVARYLTEETNPADYVHLLTRSQYSSYSTEDAAMPYKQTSKGNWRVSHQ